MSLNHPLRPLDAMEEYRRLRTRDLETFRGAWQKADAKIFRACVACGKSDAKEFFQKDGFDFVICARCDCIYVNPIPNADLLSWYYDKSSALNYFHEHVLKPSLSQRKPIFQQRVAEISRYLTPGARILEVGSSIGLFVEAAKNAGFDVFGIEPNTALAESTAKAHGISVANCFIEDFENDLRFDAVVMWEVIEHMANPASVLQKVRSLLKAGGTLAMTLPNVAGIEFGLCGEHHEMVEAPSHLNYYSPETITLLLRRAQFNVTAVSTPGILDFVNVLNHLYRSRGARTQKHLWPASKRPEDIGGAFLRWLHENATSDEHEQINKVATQVVQRSRSSGNMFVVARAELVESD